MGTTFKRIDENRNTKNTQAKTCNFCTWQLNNLKPSIAKPFQLTYLAKGVGRWHPLSENYLSLPWIYRPTTALPEHILKVVNICDMHWIGGIKVLVKCTLRVISAIVEIVRKSALTLLLDNIMASKAEVIPKIIDITLLY